MTVEEMIAAEKDQGLEPEQISDGRLLFGTTETFDLSSYSGIYRVQGSFVNDIMDNIYYLFDTNGLLCQMIYSTSNCYTSSTAFDDATPMLADLYSDKYGDPVDRIINIENVIDIQDFPEIHQNTSSIMTNELSLEDIAYQWFVPYGDSMLAEIELQNIKWDTEISGQSIEGYSMVIGYTRITEDDYTNSCIAYAEDAAETVNQFNDDI
jgi:hypothetical protein